MPENQSVAFIGLGAIGQPMAALLHQAGVSVIGVDPYPRPNASASGFPIVGDISLAPGTSAVVVMVASPEQLDGVVLKALAENTVRDQLWIIMSTVGPESVQLQSQRLLNAGAWVVDAPVTGGVARALAGQLTIFASGSQEAVEEATAVLRHLGTVRLVGSDLGNGQAIKVVNQHLCSVHIVAAAEALFLAKSLGLDPLEVFELVRDGAGGSWMLSDRGPRMLMESDIPVTSTIGIFVKDSSLVSDAAQTAGVQLPLLEEARRRYLLAEEAGLVTQDDSRVIETYYAAAGTAATA